MLELPTEIWTRVAKEYSDRASLKALRLACSKFDDVAQRALFRTVLIRPNLDSLSRASRIASAPVFNRHVRELHLFPQSLHCEAQTYHQFCEMCPGDSPARRVPTRLEFYDMLALRSSQTAFDALDVASDMMILVQSFQQLRAIKYLDLWEDYEVESFEEDSFTKRYGTHHLIRFPNTTVQRFCFANANTGILRSLQTLELEWDLSLIDTKVITPLTFPFSELKHFHLRIATSKYIEQRPSVPKICGIIECMPSLIELGIGSTTEMAYERTEPTLCDQVWPFVLGRSWNGLRKLRLFQIRCEEQHLCAFLLRHRATIRCLELEEVFLTKSVPRYQRRSSATRFLWSLKYISNLQTFTMKNGLYSDGGERWSATNSHTGLYQKVHDYVCRGGAFPFPDLVGDVVPVKWSLAWTQSSQTLGGFESELVRNNIEQDLALGYPPVPADLYDDPDLSATKNWTGRLLAYSDETWGHEPREF